MRQLRKDRGLTQIRAAEQVGVPVRKWQRWESGEATPRDYFGSLLVVFPEAKEQVLAELFPSITATSNEAPPEEA